MRHALLAIVLVIAAFLGGALVNGPGLDWAMNQLAPTRNAERAENAAEPAVDEFEGLVESADADAQPDAEVAAERSNRPSKLPISPKSRLAASPITDPLEPTWPPRRSRSAADSKSDRKSPASQRIEAPGGPTVQRPVAGSEKSALTEATAATQPDDAPEHDALDTLRNTEAASSPTDSHVATRDRSGPWSDAEDTIAPARAVLPEPGASESPERDRREPDRDPQIRLASSRSEPTEPAAWERLEARMEALEVGRYWVEGVPGGEVRFRCLVPVVGERAVSQHFEAEAANTAQAIEAALRRIELWKASLEAASHDR